MHRRQFLNTTLAGSAALLGAGSLQAQPTNQLRHDKVALLVAVPDEGDNSGAVQRDQDLMRRAILRHQGYSDQNILTLHGSVGRTEMFNFLRTGGEKLEHKEGATLFLHYTGSGHMNRMAPQESGVHLGQRQHARWEEVFGALNLPRGAKLNLIPDCCYTNTLKDRMPAGGSALILRARPGEVRCALNHDFTHNGQRTRYGVLSYYVSRAFYHDITMRDLAEDATRLMQRGIERGEIPQTHNLPLTVTGREDTRVLE